MTLEKPGRHDNELPKEPEFCGRCNYVKRPSCCEQARELEAERKEKETLIEAKTLGGRKAYEEYTVERWDATMQPQSLKGKYEKALSAARGFDAGRENLFFFGPPGAGKTHLATIALRKYPPHMRNVIHGSEFVAQLNAARLNNTGNPFDTMQLLLLDDIDKASIKEFGAAEVWRFFNGWMMDARGGLIMTSNCDLRMLAEKWGDSSIASRMLEIFKVYGFVGAKDVREVKYRRENK